MDGFVEKGVEEIRLESSSLELAKESFGSFFLVCIVGAEGVDTVYHTVDDPWKKPRRVAGVGRDVKMETRWFFIKSRSDLAIADADCQVHEVNRFGEITDDPFQFVNWIIH